MTNRSRKLSMVFASPQTATSSTPTQKSKIDSVKERASLSNRALLVSVNIRQWDARRLDKLETEAVNTRNAAVAKAARVHKSLLPGAAELEAVQKMSGEIRSYVYKHTLPWAEGVQILKTRGFIDFNTKLNELKSEWERRVQTFIDAYPRLQHEAQQALGKLFNADDYPAQDELAERFRVDTRFLPVPEENDWRVDLGADIVAELQDSVRDQLQQAQQAAMKEAWDRLFKVVKHAHERLAQPDAIFRDSLVENAVELCSILPSLNISNDPDLETSRQDIMSSLCGHDPKQLRKDSKVRQKAAQDLARVMDKMRGFYGSAA